MKKKLLLIIMIAALLSCSNKNTTGVGYENSTENTYAASSNETTDNSADTEINNNKEDIIKHKGVWSGELKSDNTIEYLPWKFEIKQDASIDVYISGSSYPEPNLSFDKINKPKENTLEFTVIDDYISYKTIADFNSDNSAADVVVEVSFIDDEENTTPAYYRGTMTKQ